MSLVTVIAVVLLVSLVLYALTGGADYGGGMWDLLAQGPRAKEQREVIASAIRPIWEANHVWLILVVTVPFTAFPRGFAAVMTALHIPLTIVLIEIILRGAAFVFRSYGPDRDRIEKFWSRVFGAASFLTPFFLGMSLGALSSGDIHIDESGQLTSGFFSGWTDHFAFSCGLFAQGMFALLAATYLTVDAEGEPEVQEDFRKRALISEVLLLPAAALVFFVAMAKAPLLFERLTAWWAPWILIGTSVFAIVGTAALWKRWFRGARLAVGTQVAFIVVGWGLV